MTISDGGKGEWGHPVCAILGSVLGDWIPVIDMANDLLQASSWTYDLGGGRLIERGVPHCG